jgi:hypothetical protein
MQGLLLFEAPCDVDTVTVKTLFSSAGAQCFINYQVETSGYSPIYVASHNGHASVTKQLIEAHCNIEMKTWDGYTTL